MSNVRLQNWDQISKNQFFLEISSNTCGKIYTLSVHLNTDFWNTLYYSKLVKRYRLYFLNVISNKMRLLE